MDVDLLSKIIKELILDKDRVVLPGLGCFVAEVVPATFSDKGYTINPPYRKLSLLIPFIPEIVNIGAIFFQCFSVSLKGKKEDISCFVGISVIGRFTAG